MDWRFSLFLLAMLGLLLGFTWGTSESGLCNSAFVKSVVAESSKDGALNCFDFWFNRYQTFFGALSAIIAAWLAWRGVMKQVDKAEEQILLTRQQNYNSFQDNISRQISELSMLLKKIERMSRLHQRAFDLFSYIRDQARMIVERDNETHRRFKYRIDDYYDQLLIEYSNILEEIEPLQDSIDKSINISVFDEFLNERLSYYIKRARYIYEYHTNEITAHKRLIEMVFSPQNATEFAWTVTKARMAERNISLDGPYKDDFNVYPPIEAELRRLVILRALTRSQLEAEVARDLEKK